MTLRTLRFLGFLLLLAGAAQAQINVALTMERRSFLMHEPVLATVAITNLSGHSIVFDDTAQGQWFSFDITAPEDRKLPPRKKDYELEPLAVPPGQTVKRTVNLHALYPLGDYGPHRITAAIFLAEADRYFASAPVVIEIVDGHRLWKQTVGVPESAGGASGDQRTYSLMYLDLHKGRTLYVRVEGVNDGLIYGTYPLGRTVEGMRPQAMLDAGNTLWVLHSAGHKQYLLSRVGVGGELLGQSAYVGAKRQPYLRKTPEGELQLVGGVRQERLPPGEEPAAVPKLSDRPPGLAAPPPR